MKIPSQKYDADGTVNMYDFVVAAKENDVEELSRILRGVKSAINKSDWVHNETALTISTKLGRKESVEFLLTNGVDVNCANRKGKRSLYYVIVEKQVTCMKLILSSKNVEVNPVVHEGLTPLMLSAKLGFDSCVKLLVDHGCDINRKSKVEKKGAIHYSIQPEPWQPTLIQKKASDDDSRFQCLRALVESGADVNLSDADGMTPLHYAIRNRNARAVELLVLEGCSVNVAASWETALSCCVGPVTPALLASYVSNTRIISILLAAGCDFLTCPAMMKIKSNHPHRLCLGMCHRMPGVFRHDVPPIKKDPKDLKRLCRLAIRKVMGQNIARCSDQLRLPKPVELYISKTEYQS
ncbi:putative ankyrin repeat protein RF_0381 [Gigantopelta aegis]|uniref:putative ankyrin repeat protein RF_0381 n=1 Tax=Gigantopelta aegis TaxID=1735272 RepID=UPI001B887A5C|nr:putative ankyrin repeat protein RF_0381 [Gigantopelta aegis]